MIWFVSDLHFGHEAIISFCNRPFMGKGDMQDALIWNWNNVVSDSDIVYVLGDFAFLNGQAVRGITHQLRGHKILILGNHDKFPKINSKDYLGFADVHKELDITIDGKTITLSHYPFVGDNTPEDRFKERRPVDFGQWLLHGHVHDTWKIKREQRMINCGVDVHNYTPISEDYIKDVINGKE